MRRLDVLITQSRRSTENLDFTETAGIQDEELIQYFNDGQDELYGIIQNVFPDMFQKEKIYDVVASQEEYDIPEDCYIGERIEMVEYSRSGQDKDYYLLKKGNKRERLNGTSGNPSFYLRRSGKILIQPKPEVGGKLRVLYQRSIPVLDVRRGQVLAVTLGATTITSLTLDPAQEIQDSALLEENYISVVDKYGTVKMKAIPISAINTTTGDVTIDAGFEFEAGESIAVGDYVLRGKYSSTNGVLPDSFENYMIEYVNVRTLMRDSSADAGDLATLLKSMEDGVQRTVNEPDGDVNQIAVLDTQFLSDGSYY